LGNAKAIKEKLEQWASFAKENYKKAAKKELSLSGKIFLSGIHRSLKEGTGAMEEMLFRTAFEKLFFQMQRCLKDYLKRKDISQDLLNYFIESQAKAMSPFCPFISEEIWSCMGKKDFASLGEWPKHDESKIDEEAEAAAEFADSTKKDIMEIMKLAKIDKPKKIRIFVAEKWKYDFLKKLKGLLSDTRDASQIIRKLMSTQLKSHGQEISRMVPKLLNDINRIPSIIMPQEDEINALDNASKNYGEEFKCGVEIINAESSKEQKARQAMPGKAAILVE
ncbi:class I tRNA ligase family protein, partial [Candidatus Woesearchaeota archaeon]|nr:class I tRNA ligase family protein [Candidatus Woesearchaeota archaeon]